MRQQAGTIGQRLAATLTAVLCAAVLSSRPADAHNGTGKVRGTCQVTNLSGRITMSVQVDNLWTDSIYNVEPSDLLGSRTGTAEFFVQTFPRPAREVLPGKSVEFDWKGRSYGDGLLDLSVEVFAEFQDGHVESTGIVNCNRLAIGNPNGSNTPVGGDITATPTHVAIPDTPLPSPTNTGRATRTPIPDRPTRTPRLDPSSTPTRVRPTGTDTPVRPTNTFTATRTARATRTPFTLPTRTPTRTAPPLPTATWTRQAPTRTSIPQRPTRTPMPNPTPRPTRTPIVIIQPTPTRTPTSDPPGGGSLVASCSLRRNIDFVSVTMVVENRTGADVRQISATTLNLDPEGGSLFFDRTGPSPGLVPLLRNGMSATFQWTGRLSPGGTMGFSASATANGANGPVRSTLADCGVTGTDAAQFDPASFSGTCSMHPGDNGELTFEVRNGSGEALTNVEAFFVGRSAVGSAQLLSLRGPAPRNAPTMPPASRREFVWAGRLLGDGTLTVQFEARGTRSTTNERISTGHIECSQALGTAAGGNLPDLGVDEQDQRQSVLIQEKDFPADHCAVVEGCVGGTGRRRLLRFNTVTPNFGPGEVFVGDPANNPRAVYSQCHMHYHVQDYADYRLLDMAGNLVARGHKQAFCLVDLWQYPGAGGSREPKFVDCGFQGISPGWADIYNRGLDCQWIDITGVPSGRYILEVVVNPARMIPERDYSNNTARTEVVIP